MSELIAIPLESDRRAVHVLAALQWLEAEYRGNLERAVTPPAGDAAIPAPSRPSRWTRIRRAGRRVRVGRLHVSVVGGLAGGLAGAAVALLSSALWSALPALTAVPAYAYGAAMGAMLGASLGALAGAVAAAAVNALLPATPQRKQDVRTATWLISYIMRDGPSESGRLRGSFLQITLPIEAEERLKTILARVDATVAR
jgi:hypothetical protein